MVFDVATRKQGAGVVGKTNLREIFVVIVFHVAQKYNITRKQGASIAGKTNRGTRDESQWIVAQRLLSTLTIPGFS